MGGYLVSFSVYTFAMVGFLFLAVFVYRKTNVGANAKSKTGGMQIEESLNLSPRKSLHVVRVNDEKFLIAADLERTEFLAKLDNNTTISNEIQFPKTIVNQSKLVDNGNVTSILASKLKKEPKDFPGFKEYMEYVEKNAKKIASFCRYVK